VKTIPLDELLGERFTPEQRERIQTTSDRLVREVMLTELRQLTGKTQSEVAKRLGIRQPSLSKIERQSDMKVSTLSGIAEAYGGKLRVVIEFPEHGSVPIVIGKATGKARKTRVVKGAKAPKRRTRKAKSSA